MSVVFVAFYKKSSSTINQLQKSIFVIKIRTKVFITSLFIQVPLYKGQLQKQNMLGKQIPIIDLAPYLDPTQDTKQTSQRIRSACKDIGFFYVKNHGVPEELIDSIFQNTKKFFDLSVEEKNQIRMEISEHAFRGYYQIGHQFTNGVSDFHQAVYFWKEQDQNDQRVIQKVPFHGANQYPRQVPALKNDVRLWLKEMDRLGALLMQCFAESLGLKRTFFADSLCRDHYGLMLLLHYPQSQLGKDIQPLGEHCDYGFITMLIGSEKGLQVKTVNNQWVDIVPIPGTFVINIGDMLQKITKGLYKSTPHRVVVTGKERFSIPYNYDSGFNEKLYELDFQMSEEEKQVLEKTNSYQRIDKLKIINLDRTIGEHYIYKHAGNFPQLGEKYLKKFIDN